MQTVNFLAQLWGFSIVIVSLALLINTKQIDHFWHLAKDKMLVFILGMVIMVLGVASVLTYNVWQSSWKVIITLLGWITLIKGIALLVIPGSIEKMYSKIKIKNEMMSVLLLICVAFGCFLIYKGFVL